MSHDSESSKILIRRSKTRGRPVVEGGAYAGQSLLQVAELAVSFLADPNDDGFGNGGDRLYIGAGDVLYRADSDSFGDSVSHLYSSEIHTIGGKYFTDMMNHQRGELTAASAILVDDSAKIDRLLVDNLRLDLDSVSTAAGSLTLRADDNQVIVNSNLQVTQNVQIDGTLTVDGIATLRAGTSGTITVGDSNTDNVVFGADVNSRLVPNIADTYDLGDSVQRWNDIYGKRLIVDSADVDILQVNNLTEDRVVIVGPNGVLEDDPNFTYDSVRLNVSALARLDGGVEMTDSATIAGILTVQDSTSIAGDLTLDAGGSPLTSDIVLPRANHVGSGTYDSKIRIGPSASETQLGRGYLSQSNNGLVIVAGATPANLSPSQDNNWMTLNNNASGGIKFNVEAGGTIGKFEVDLNQKYSYFHSGESRFDSVRPNADNTYDLGDSAFSWKKIWAYDATLQSNLDVQGLTTLDSTTIDGDLTVTKNLYVLGDQTNISTTELVIEDKQIVIADNAPSGVIANGAGIAVGDSANPIAFARYENNGVDSAQWRFEPRIFAESIEFEVIDCGTYA